VEKGERGLCLPDRAIDLADRGYQLEFVERRAWSPVVVDRCRVA